MSFQRRHEHHLTPHSRCDWLTPTLVHPRDFEEAESGGHIQPAKWQSHPINGLKPLERREYPNVS